MIRAELLIYFPTKLFFSGERVTGYAELRLPTAMGIYGIKLEIFGREYYTYNMQEAIQTNAAKKTTKVFYEHSERLEGQGSKKKEEREFFGLFKKQVNTMLPAGSYRYDFDVKLPDVLPPTYKTTQLTKSSKSNYGVPSVDYELRCTCMHAEKTVGDLVSSAALPIGGTLLTPTFLATNTIPFSETRTKTFMFANGAIVSQISLPSKTFLTGDFVMGQLTVENTSSKTVSDSSLSFIQRVDCMKPGYKEPIKSDVYVIKKLVLGDLKANEKKVIILNQNTGVKVPDFCVESIFLSQKIGSLVNVNYFLKLTGKLSMATDLHEEFIIYVANRTRHQPPQQFVQQPPQQMYAASPMMTSQYPQQMPMTNSQYPPQMINSQYPQQMQDPRFAQQQQITQQQLIRTPSMYDSQMEGGMVQEGTAPPEQEVTEYHDYQDDQSNMALYPQMQRPHPTQYSLPPVPLQVYEDHARKLLEFDSQHVPEYNITQNYQNTSTDVHKI